MRILLFVPKGNGPGQGRKWNRDWPEELEEAVSQSQWKIVTPGVLVLAALAQEKGLHVDVIDEEFQEVDREVQYDIAAMYTVTPNVKRAYQWARFYREGGTHVVLGGVHASVNPGEAGDHCDTLILGEAEQTWPVFLDDYQKKNP